MTVVSSGCFTADSFTYCVALFLCHLCLLLQTTSEKALRKQLQQFFKTDMGEKKAFIKEHVSRGTCTQGVAVATTSSCRSVCSLAAATSAPTLCARMQWFTLIQAACSMASQQLGTGLAVH